MATITLKGREITLLYTTWEMKQIQEEIGKISQVIYLVSGVNPEDNKDAGPFGEKEHLTTLGKLITILGNAGLEENGQEADLTEKKVLRAIRPKDIMQMSNACISCMLDGMESEIPEKQQEGPVDVTLEEIKKKEEKDG